MSKLFFRYSSMGAGKTLELLKVAYNYEEKNKKVLLLTSSFDNRDGIGKITSRTGLSRDAMIISSENNIIDMMKEYSDVSCVLIDEAQFLTKKHVFQLTDVVDFMDIPVICYGLRSDFKLNPFEGSSYLMAIADDIEEIKTICWCGKKAIINARVSDGKIIKKGEQIQIGGNESYTTLCRKHYKKGKLNE
jgi:thymidine kinase